MRKGPSFILLFLALGQAPFLAAAPASPVQQAEQILRRDTLLLLAATHDWKAFLEKADAPARQKHLPELLSIRADAGQVGGIEGLRPLELRFDVWQRAIIAELFPGAQASSIQDEVSRLAQAQVAAFEEARQFKRRIVLKQGERAYERWLAKLRATQDEASLDQLFDSMGVPRRGVVPANGGAGAAPSWTPYGGGSASMGSGAGVAPSWTPSGDDLASAGGGAGGAQFGAPSGSDWASRRAGAGDGEDPAGNPYMTLAGMSTGSQTAKQTLFSACREPGSGATKQSLLAILPTWVKVGTEGGAVYLLRSFMGGRSCIGNPNDEIAKDYLDSQGFTDIPQSELQSSYSREIVGRVNKSGRICGDCVTWQQALLRCAGYSGPNTGTIKVQRQKAKSFLVSSKRSCKDASEQAPGGLKFGDLFHFQFKNGSKHMFMYTGGAGLPYELVEMGGWGSKNKCRMVPGLKNRLNCVKAHASKESYGWWKTQVQYCDVFRVLD